MSLGVVPLAMPELQNLGFPVRGAPTEQCP